MLLADGGLLAPPLLIRSCRRPPLAAGAPVTALRGIPAVILLAAVLLANLRGLRRTARSVVGWFPAFLLADLPPSPRRLLSPPPLFSWSPDREVMVSLYGPTQMSRSLLHSVTRKKLDKKLQIHIPYQNRGEYAMAQDFREGGRWRERALSQKCPRLFQLSFLQCFFPSPPASLASKSYFLN